MNLPIRIDLHWKPLKKALDLDFPNTKESGIYIWGFTIDDKFIPYYVGKADNIHGRIATHLSSIMSGRYTIFNKDCLKNFKLHKSQKELSSDGLGKIYIPYWPKSIIYFLNNKKKLEPHINFMLESFTFSYIKIPTEKFPADILDSLEKFIINYIGKENLINTRSGKVLEKYFWVYDNSFDFLKG